MTLHRLSGSDPIKIMQTIKKGIDRDLTGLGKQHCVKIDFCAQWGQTPLKLCKLSGKVLTVLLYWRASTVPF